MSSDPNIAHALAALQHPDIAAALNCLALLQRPDVAQALGVLQRYSNIKRDEPAPAPPKPKRKLIKPVVTNNLFVITLLWTFIGLFLLYAADKSDGADSHVVAYTIFALYALVQSLLIVFILLVTLKQVKQIQNRSISLAFLVQGWLALVLAFAGTYLFLQQVASLRISTSKSLDGSAAKIHDYSATAFGSVCMPPALNETSFGDLSIGKKLCVVPPRTLLARDALRVLQSHACARYTLHVTRHTSHVTRHTSHVTRHSSHVTLHTSHVTRCTQVLPASFRGQLLDFCRRIHPPGYLLRL